jgi:small GTP-binding protein
MDKKTIKYQKFAKKIDDLLADVRETLRGATDEEIQQLCYQVPESVDKSVDKLNVVFAGQYSAGKSSIIKYLTGNDDIEIGAGITTDKVHVYDWENIEIVDTPGVHTEIRPDHDEESYKAISQADLVVFVVTNELFDDHIGEHFRKLAIDLGKGHEMMLVINKMERAQSGNNKYSRKVLKDDLEEMLTPYSPEDLKTTFIDAELAIESTENGDSEDLDESRVSRFISRLNDFIEEKGFVGQLTTPLYELDKILEDAYKATPSEDEDLDALHELLTQKRRSLLETKQRIRQSVNAEIQEVTPQIRKKGRNIADMISKSAKEDQINEEIKKAEKDVEKSTNKLMEDVQGDIEEHLNELNRELEEISESEFAQNLGERLEAKFSKSGDYEKFHKAGQEASKLGDFLMRHSFNQNGGLSGLMKLSNFSGTNAHSVVYNVGKFFGHNFKPWEAVKWARIIGNAGKFLSVAGSVVSIVLEFKQDRDEKKLEKDLRDARVKIRKGFNDVAHEVEDECLEVLKKCLDEIIKPEIESVNKELKELRDIREAHTDLNTSISEQMDDVRQLISEVHHFEAA